MKSLFLILFTSISVSAQIGINTTSPMATLEVVGKPSVASVYDGIIPPKITGDQLQAKNYSAAQDGALIYVTQPATSPSGQTINITSKGLYSFDNSLNRWTAISSSNTKNVYCNTTNPNSATIFDDQYPATTHNSSLIRNAQNTYYGTDGSVWIWNGTMYISYVSNYNLNIGQSVSIFRTMPNSDANNTVLAASGLITLDGLIRIDVRKVDNTFYSPRIVNISGATINITYSSHSSIGDNKNEVNKSVTNNTAVDIDSNGIVYWTNSSVETITCNFVLPNGKWYEAEWFAYEVNSVKQIYITVRRKY